MKTQFHEGRVTIRPFENADVPQMFNAVRESIPELSPWLPWCRSDYTQDETANFIHARPQAWASEEEYSFAIVDTETKMLLGGIGLNRINRRDLTGNIGYWVRTSETRQGVGSTAVRLIAQFGFKEVGLQRLEIMAAIENIASQRTAAKAGARREGILRKRLLLAGQPHDAALFSLIAEDLQA